MAYLDKPKRIETALLTLDWCVTIRAVTAAAFSTEQEAIAYRDTANRAAGEWFPIAHLWRIDWENDLCICQVDHNFPSDFQPGNIRAVS